jgi:hypothetical protein
MAWTEAPGGTDAEGCSVHRPAVVQAAGATNDLQDIHVAVNSCINNTKAIEQLCTGCIQLKKCIWYHPKGKPAAQLACCVLWVCMDAC